MNRVAFVDLTTTSSIAATASRGTCGKEEGYVDPSFSIIYFFKVERKKIRREDLRG